MFEKLLNRLGCKRSRRQTHRRQPEEDGKSGPDDRETVLGRGPRVDGGTEKGGQERDGVKGRDRTRERGKHTSVILMSTHVRDLNVSEQKLVDGKVSKHHTGVSVGETGVKGIDFLSVIGEGQGPDYTPVSVLRFTSRVEDHVSFVTGRTWWRPPITLIDGSWYERRLTTEDWELVRETSSGCRGLWIHDYGVCSMSHLDRPLGTLHGNQCSFSPGPIFLRHTSWRPVSLQSPSCDLSAVPGPAWGCHHFCYLIPFERCVTRDRDGNSDSLRVTWDRIWNRKV